MKISTMISAIFLATGIGCSTYSGPASNTETPANNATAAAPASDPNPWSSSPFSPSGDAKADIEKMADRFLSLRSFSARMEGTGTIPVNSELEFVAPDRFRFRHLGGQDAKPGEMVVVGKTTYLNIGGQWQKMDIGMSVPNMRETFTRDGLKYFKDIKYLGEENAEGKNAYHYSYTGQMPGSKKEYDSQIWINADDGTPVRISTNYRSGDLKTMDIVYDYSKQISIEPPIQ